MSIPMIETGYKPEFGLGALYQGFNAANADQSAQEEIIRQFLANQRERNSQPLDLQVKQLDALKATSRMNDPNWMNALMSGEIGENQSKTATGEFDTDTLQSKIAATLARNKFDTTHNQVQSIQEEELQRQMQALGQEPQQTPQPTIGFPMNPVPQTDPNQWGGEGKNILSNFVIPPMAAAKEKNLPSLLGNDYKGAYKEDLAILDKELSRKQSPQVRAELLAERQRILNRPSNTPQVSIPEIPYNNKFSDQSQIVGSIQQRIEQLQKQLEANPENSSISDEIEMLLSQLNGESPQVQSVTSNSGGNLLERMSKLRMMNPQHMGKLEEIQKQGDSRVAVAEIAANARLEAERQKATNKDSHMALVYAQIPKAEATAAQYETQASKLVGVDAQQQALRDIYGDNKGKEYTDYQKAQAKNAVQQRVQELTQYAQKLRKQADELRKVAGIPVVESAPKTSIAPENTQVVHLE